jgi:two-component system, cell cycle response regulator
MFRTSRPKLTEPQALALTRHHRALARKLALPAAALVLLVVPVYQLQELFQIGSIAELCRAHLGWRAVPMAVAVVALVWCSRRKDGYGAPLLLRALALSVMIMIFGLFAVNWLTDCSNVERMVRGVIISTFAVTMFSLKGARELIVFFGAPFLILLAFMKAAGHSVLAIIAALFDPLMLLVIAAIASEILYRTWLAAFIANQQLAEHAATDPLTGLSNRRHIEPQLLGETSRALRHRATFSVLMADLDHFKLVNDRYGHDAGDEVLREVARRIRSMLRTEDRPARWGGEEFLVLLTDTDADQAAIVAEKIREALAETPIEVNGQSIDMTISIGVAEHQGEDDPLDLIRRADRALYQAKDEGRNRVCTDRS